MTPAVNWPAEFARIIACQACTTSTDPKLLRDNGENVPQPGYVGPNYSQSRVALVGQNPAAPKTGTSKTLTEADLPYTQALRALRDSPTEDSYRELSSILARFIPQWPVHGSYFPLQEAGLTLSDIAYFNVVRCRTERDGVPGLGLTSNCVAHHFGRWLDALAPRTVIFIGKWAADKAAIEVSRRGIPFAYMNRMRSLSAQGRAANREAVVRLVRAAMPDPSPFRAGVACAPPGHPLPISAGGSPGTSDFKSEEPMGHVCEELVAAALYLEDVARMSSKQLSRLHHDSLLGRGVTFKMAYRYFSTNKELKPNNVSYAERLKFVASGHRHGNVALDDLIGQALKRWPL